MEWLAILDRISSGEDANTEFKRGLGDLSAVGKAICAFVNTGGGVLILGVNDSQEIVGVSEESGRVQERLTSFLHSGCSSAVTAFPGRHHDPKGWVHWVEIPHRRGFEPLTYSGRVWVRRGRSNVEPSSSELQELYNVFGYILTEERAIQAASISDIDLLVFRDYLRRLGIDIDDSVQPDSVNDLRNRGVVAEIGDDMHPTLYGLLAFGKQPQKYSQTRDFRIECVAYGGDDRASDVLQVAQATGRLDEQVTRGLGWLADLGRFEEYAEVIRSDRHLVPRRAIREALVNAVVHRDYVIRGSRVLLEAFRDHVDVTSPGALPNHMTIESVIAGGHPRSRNESMAHFMLNLGLMEQRGRGWPIMRREMQVFNVTEPRIVHDTCSKYVRVRFVL